MPTLTYATVQNFKDYPGTSPALADSVIEDALAMAEKDIDSIFLGRRVDTITGRRFTLSDLVAYQLTVLSDATCAQAVYRLDKGPAWFEDGEITIQGPDYTIDRSKVRGGGLVAPMALRELRLGGLLPRGGRALA